MHIILNACTYVHIYCLLNMYILLTKLTIIQMLEFIIIETKIKMSRTIFGLILDFQQIMEKNFVSLTVNSYSSKQRVLRASVLFFPGLFSPEISRTGQHSKEIFLRLHTVCICFFLVHKRANAVAH